MSNNRYCVIMAGGVGARLWPRSRQAMPKQFLEMMGSGKSFLRHTFERFLPLFALDNFIVVTNERYLDLVLEQIPELRPDQVLCEPIGRNTAPAICYAAYSLLSRDPQAEMVVTPADHYVADEQALRSTVEECLEFVAEQGGLLAVGIRPTHPETGYGYLQASDLSHISRIKSFTEKPDLELAQTFVHCGEFFWNSGIFVWRASDIVEAVERHLPEHYALFNSISDLFGTDGEAAAVRRVFMECRPISIDFGVMERAENVYMRVGEFGWSDIGTWSKLYQDAPKDRSSNVVNESVLYHDTQNSVVSLPEGKVAVVSGLRDYIVVDTDDVLMICPRSEEQNIKKFIDDLKYKMGDELI